MTGSKRNGVSALFADVKPSISLHLIRHAESGNNEVFRDAHFKFKRGTDDFDENGWAEYVGKHRRADPALSIKGQKQVDVLAKYLVPHLKNQASQPIRIIVSPMRRALESIRPTLEGLQRATDKSTKIQVVVVTFFHESGGCHVRDTADEGMSPAQIRDLLKDSVVDTGSDIEFIGFPDIERGWNMLAKGQESRFEAEARSAKFYLWLCEYLDAQMTIIADDIFDAGVVLAGEETEDDNDKHSERLRPRRTVLAVGHGDFMSAVMKRFIAGFGYSVETNDVAHRSAFSHYNTGISEFEYFGQGRFLTMGCNQTPHLHPSQYSELRGGASLKDGWGAAVPGNAFVLSPEIVEVTSAKDMDDYIREQVVALRGLYLSSTKLESDGINVLNYTETTNGTHVAHFVVRRGMKVVGALTYSEMTGHLTNVVVLPSASEEIGEKLFTVAVNHARKLGTVEKIVVHPLTVDTRRLLGCMSFSAMEDESMVLNIKES